MIEFESHGADWVWLEQKEQFDATKLAADYVAGVRSVLEKFGIVAATHDHAPTDVPLMS